MEKLAKAAKQDIVLTAIPRFVFVFLDLVNGSRLRRLGERASGASDSLPGIGAEMLGGVGERRSLSSRSSRCRLASWSINETATCWVFHLGARF
jgi:hypothetical protein